MQLPKPPKLFRTRQEPTAEPETPPPSDTTTDAPRIWSPPPQPQMEETAGPSPETPSAPTESALADSSASTPSDAEIPPAAATSSEDLSRYARPKINASPTEEPVFNPPESPVVSDPIPVEPSSEPAVEEETSFEEPQPLSVEEKPFDISAPPPPEETENAIIQLLGPDQKIVRAKSVSSIPFSDIWYTAEKVAYIRDKTTHFALVPFLSEDLEDFYKALEQGYTGQSSYAIRFAGESYRVERIITLSGAQYNCRKMPTSVPDIYTLGLPKHIVDYMLTLSQESGLILFGGPTGMGKTTSASALMQKYLEAEGGFMYTIEDPPEMPLDGLYHAQNGGLGLCKQCPVDNERWGDGIKSALRSRPRYILVGEIRTPETASQVLRAATSGHLVLSTIHASTVEDALESIIKYASGAGLTEELAADLLARGILAVVHQRLEGSSVLRPVITAAFANPHLTGGDQMRSLIRNKTINLQTLIEAQSSRLFQGRPLFDNYDRPEK